MFSDFYNPEQIKDFARIPKSHSSIWHRFILRQKGTQNNPSVVHTCALKSNKERHQRQEKRKGEWVCFSMDVIRTVWRDIPTELYPTQSSDMLLKFETRKFRHIAPPIYSDLPSAAASFRSFNTRCVPWSAQR
jgi:hypothetical protein